MIKISKRLSHLADMVGYPVLADVGTDHGYLPIFLLQAGKIKKAFAMDVREGPLLAAKEHIDACGLGDYITVKLSDGVAALEPGEADSVLIAGMGGDVMLHILKEGDAVARAARELILQPQSKIKDVREYLYRKGYVIDRENMVFEDGKYYSMMHVISEKKKAEPRAYTEREWQVICRYGEQLLNRQDETLQRYLSRMARQYQGILEGLERQRESEAILERKKAVRTELAYAEYALKWQRRAESGCLKQGADKEA